MKAQHAAGWSRVQRARRGLDLGPRRGAMSRGGGAAGPDHRSLGVTVARHPQGSRLFSFCAGAVWARGLW